MPSQATHIDYSIYITDEAYTYYDFHPDDVAGTMIHEAVHAWQESIVRNQLSTFLAAFSMDPRSLQWTALYHNGMERQAIEITKKVHDVGTIDLSQIYLRDTERYRAESAGGLDSPVEIPVYGLIIL